MAAEPQISEAIFREAIRFSLGKLGQPEQELKQEQLEAIKAICVDKKDVLAVLIYQCLISFAIVKENFILVRISKKTGCVVTVVSPLNALMKDQVKKTGTFS